MSMARVSDLKTTKSWSLQPGAHRGANIIGGGEQRCSPGRGGRSRQALNKNIPPIPKPKPLKTKRDGGGDGRRAGVSLCGSNFTHAGPFWRRSKFYNQIFLQLVLVLTVLRVDKANLIR